jgi:hypothetical protein
MSKHYGVTKLIRDGIYMENTKLMCLVIALFAIVAVSSNAVWARGGYVGHGSYGGSFSHGHSHSRTNLGIYLGGGYYGGGFYGPGYYGAYGFGNPFFYPPYYNYPPVVVAPAAPPVYVEQRNAVPAQPQTNYWYYCRNPDGYYPYIKECPNGWLQVVPQPTQ